MIIAALPIAMQGINGMRSFFETTIQIIPARQAMPIAGNHHNGPSKRPISPEYQISAKPSLLPEIKKAMVKINKPKNAPAKLAQSASACAPGESACNMIINKKMGKAAIKKMRGTMPVFKSDTAMAMENDVNKSLQK